MPTAAAPNPRAASAVAEEHANNTNFDQDVDDFWRDLPVGNEASNDNAAQPAKDVDEEIKVRKKRMPVPKLDETRILSDAGVPKLRKIAQTKLKFRGKSHEFTDISGLLNTYQLWLDDLYPRAKFRDALSMVEKLGHSKRMQITRRAWIDGTKPSRREASPERLADIEMRGGLDGLPEQRALRQDGSDDDDDLFGEHSDQRPAGDADGPEIEPNDMPEDDELDALMAENPPSAPSAPGASSRPQQKPKGPFEEENGDDGGDEPDQDELDALLAEEPYVGGATKAASDVPAAQDAGSEEHRDDFADEEEIMAGMGGNW